MSTFKPLNLWQVRVYVILLLFLSLECYYTPVVFPLLEDVFDLEVHRPWEFNVTFPIRSVLLPKILYGVPYIFLATFTPDLQDLLGWDIRTPYVMLIIPRLVTCALSFVTDFCLYKICVLYGQKYR